MVDLGAEHPAFGTIVASGPNGRIPHHAPTDRPLRRGDLITMDFGALYGGYHADMTRTVALGEPAGWQREIYGLVAAAQRAGIEAARPDVNVADVDAAARDMMRDAGHGEHFGHGLGHGVGLEVHEAPTIGYGRTGKLAQQVPESPSSLVSTCPARAESGSRTFLSWAPTGRAWPRSSPRRRESFSSFYLETERGHHERPEERHDLEHRPRAVDRGRGFQHVKPGKGPAFVRTKLKNVTSGKVIDRTFNAGVKVDVATIDRREMQYLYREGGDFVFMDTQDYGQPRIPADVVGDAANYLLEEQTVTVAFNDGTPLYVDMPGRRRADHQPDRPRRPG